MVIAVADLCFALHADATDRSASAIGSVGADACGRRTPRPSWPARWRARAPGTTRRRPCRRDDVAGFGELVSSPRRAPIDDVRGTAALPPARLPVLARRA